MRKNPPYLQSVDAKYPTSENLPNLSGAPPSPLRYVKTHYLLAEANCLVGTLTCRTRMGTGASANRDHRSILVTASRETRGLC